MAGSRLEQREADDNDNKLNAFTLLMRNKASASIPLLDMCLFGRTCRTLRVETLHQRLLNDAIWAMPVSYHQKDKSMLAVIELLKQHHNLLFKKGYANGPSGMAYGSVYQILLSTMDTGAIKIVHEDIIPRIKNWKDTALEQFQAQFPFYECGRLESLYSKRNKEQVAQISDDLTAIVAAMNDDPCTNGYATREKTKAAIQKLREHLKPKQGYVIEGGLYSPLVIMNMIHDVYDKHDEQWTSELKALYSYEVVGSATRVAAPVDAQRYKVGIGHYRGGPLDRTMSIFVRGSVPEDLSDRHFYDLYMGQAVNIEVVSVPVSRERWSGLAARRTRGIIGMGRHLQDLYQSNKLFLDGIYAHLECTVNKLSYR